MSKSSTTPQEIEVDTDSSDHAKGVTRVAPDDTKGGGVNADTNQKGRGDQMENWYDKSKFVAKRMQSFARNLKREFDQTRADDEARHQREMRELRTQISSIKTDSDVASTDAAHEAEIAELQAKLEAAIESGNSKDQASLQTLIARKEAAHMEKRTKALIGDTQRKHQEKEPETKTEKQPSTNKKAASFIKQTTWWDDPEYEAEQAYANRLYVKLTTEEGMDPEDDEVYRKINKRLVAKFPKLEVKDLGDFDDDIDDESPVTIDNKRQRTAPVTNFRDRGNSNQGGDRGKIKLDDTDIATMRAMKLDPNDNMSVMAFARAKRERLEQEGA